jgi:adenosylcobyric acid synthase
MRDIDEHSHGGNLRQASAASGLPPSRILDFSANLNPLGPPPWLAEAVAKGLSEAARYPDPDSLRAKASASARFGLPPDRFLFADGADSIVFALPRALCASTVISFSPSYSGYLRAAKRSGARIVSVPLDEARDFALDGAALDDALSSSDADGTILVFLGAPNNPVGASLGIGATADLARRHMNAFFAIDESFLELSLRDAAGEGLIGKLPDNCITVRSLTKTFAMPGIRAGWAYGEAGFLKRVRAELQAWPLSSVAENAAVMAMGDPQWGAKGAEFVASARAIFESDLHRRFSGLPGFKLYPAEANFLLTRLPEGRSARVTADALLGRGILVRSFSEAEGLGDSWLRFAVKRPEENAILSEALAVILSEGGR